MLIHQALQQGVAAHHAGNLQEAERLYRAILQSQPNHADANHNLGLIAVSMNRAREALPLFKVALEVNPKMEQFWISYIDALVKIDELKSAKNAIKRAKKRGITAKKLQVLLTQSKPKVKIKELSEQQINNLLELYESNRFNEAERLALSITEEFPQHPFSWKILGAILGRTGRTTEAVTANQTAIALSPQDAAPPPP